MTLASFPGLPTVQFLIACRQVAVCGGGRPGCLIYLGRQKGRGAPPIENKNTSLWHYLMVSASSAGSEKHSTFAYILKVIKNWTVERPGNEATATYPLPQLWLDSDVLPSNLPPNCTYHVASGFQRESFDITLCVVLEYSYIHTLLSQSHMQYALITHTTLTHTNIYSLPRPLPLLPPHSSTPSPAVCH